MITQEAKTERFLTGLFGLAGKVAVVTGAGMGIGHGIARYFAQAGAKVAIADSNATAGQRVCDELNADADTVSVSFETDVSDETSVRTMMRRTVDRFGHIDILVNDAGIFPVRPLAEMTLADWEHVQSVNLRGSFLCLREAALQMLRQGEGGRIINISSIDSIHPSMVGLAHYDASKGGVNMLTRSAALEFGPGNITVNAVLPGMIATEGASAMRKDVAKGVSDVFEKRVVLGRTGNPEDIAAAVLFLASSAAAYITGQTLVVDGGFLIG